MSGTFMEIVVRVNYEICSAMVCAFGEIASQVEFKSGQNFAERASVNLNTCNNSGHGA
jgi:hypothetical protein